MADDFHLEAGGCRYRAALISFFVLCATARIPLSWGKTAGGGRCNLGRIRGAASHLLSRWAQKIVDSTSVNVSVFEEGLGGVMFVAGALEYERPFLGPLHRFMSLHPRNSIRLVPAYVKFFLSHLSAQNGICRHYTCAVEIHSWDTAPRVDAQASEGRSGIGGWAPVRNTEGELDPWLSSWFSHGLTRKDWPWICEIVISTLEALAALFSLKLFFGDEPKKGRIKVQVVPTWTDSRGNGSALNKLMSTKFPSSAVVMVLSCYLKRMSAKASVEWVRINANYEADFIGELRKLHGFDPSRRIEVGVNTLRWEILPDALRMGRQMEEDTKITRAIGMSHKSREEAGKRISCVISLNCIRGLNSHWSYILPLRLWRLQDRCSPEDHGNSAALSIGPHSPGRKIRWRKSGHRSLIHQLG